MAQYMIEAREVCKSVRRAQILKSVSMNVAQGAIAGVVGNNGSGKSVFLKCLCGLLIPTSGRIVVQGKQLVYLRDTGLYRHVQGDHECRCKGVCGGYI